MYIRSVKTNSSHLKMDGWKSTFLLGLGLYSGIMLVLDSFREGTYNEIMTWLIHEYTIYICIPYHLEMIVKQKMSRILLRPIPIKS